MWGHFPFIFVALSAIAERVKPGAGTTYPLNSKISRNVLSRAFHTDVLPQDASYRIVGGGFARDGEYPYMVSLRSFGYHYCGATIVNKRWVLTAGHCVHKQDIAIIDVVVGCNRHDGEGDRYAVDKTVKHPNYDETVVNGEIVPIEDIGLVRVTSDIVFGAKVQPVAIANDCTESESVVGVVAGWGLESKLSVSTSRKLHRIVLRLISQEECQPYLTYQLMDDNMCTLNRVGEGTCYGDSGGPLMVDDVQIGIVSTGTPCAVGKPDIYTSVCKHIHWIRENIKE